MKEVVVLGGGFGGVAAVHRLLKNDLDHTRITLIDKNAYHLFTPSLYEVATAEELKKNIAIPLRELFPRGVRLVRGVVKTLDIQQNVVILADKTRIPFDYLIIALGSQTNYFHIPGLEKYSISLKTIEDAVEIRKTIKEKFKEKTAAGENMQVVIGGGGFSGTEFAAEVIEYRRRMCGKERKHSCMGISVIQGSSGLLKELDSKVSAIAGKRLKKGGVNLCFGARIAKVTKDTVFTDDGKEYPYDVLVWTGGIKANSVAQQFSLPLNERGQIEVNQNLQVEGYPHIFAIGDIAAFIDPQTKCVAVTVAQVAEEQGAVAGENVARSIQGKYLRHYEYRHFGYVVPLRGKFAVADLGFMKLTGLLGWILQQLVLLRYLLGVLPLSKAFKRWNAYQMELVTLHPVFEGEGN